MPPHGTSLLDLPDELIGQVLSHCTLESVLGVQLTCKRLHHVCDRREVWLSVLQGFDIDCSAWIPPFHPLHSMSASELREKVIEAVRTRNAWRHPNRLSVVKEADIGIARPDRREVSVEPKVVPGGQEVLIGHTGWYELWSLEKGTLLWTAPSPEGNMFGTASDLELVEDGRALMIACEFTSADEPIRDSIVRVYRYDRQTGQGHVVAEVVFPPIYMHDLEIRGSYFMFVISRSNQRALFNWRTGCGIGLDFVCDNGPFNFPLQYSCLTAAHVIGVVKQKDDLFAFAMPLATVDGHMVKSGHFNEWPSYVHDPGSAAFLSLEHENVPSSKDHFFGTWILTIHSFKPTWKIDAPVELFILGYNLTGTKLKRIVSYRVQLSSATDGTTLAGDDNSVTSDIQLKLIDAGCALSPILPWDKSCMFNSGHIVCLRERMSCFKLFTSSEEPLCQLDLQDHPWIRDGDSPCATAVDPWSGKVIVLSNDMLASYRFETRDAGIQDEDSDSGMVVLAE